MADVEAKFAVKGSVAHKMLEFFEQNPDEELTMTDVQTKFGGCPNTVSGAVKRHSQLLEYAHVIRLKAKGVAS